MFLYEVMDRLPEKLVLTPVACFDVSNVATYLLSVNKKDYYITDVMSFNIPYPVTWFEWYVKGHRHGVLAVSGIANDLPLDTPANPTDRYTIFNWFHPINGGGEIAHTGKNVVISNNEGHVRNHPNGHPWDSALIPREISPNFFSDYYTKAGISFDKIEENDWPSMGHYAIILTTLNFLHCKNVVAQPNEFHHIRNRRLKKEGRPYFEKYYTLHIDSIKHTLKHEGQVETVGLKRALHLCRGHFSTYDEKGLFGKYYGKFWIPDHARGNPEIGAIEKDYKLEASA
jgi:hypothetical protein